MSPRRIVLSLLIAMTAAALLACGESKVPPADSVITLGEALEAAGFSVNGPSPNDVLSSRFFSIPGVRFVAGGETVHAYEFDSEDAAALEKATVSEDGYGIGSKYVNWSVAPSFYASGRLIVIYDGDQPKVKETLANAMGERFAGTDPES